jgi:membrane protein DedA with SNARE-associated domain
MEEAERWFARRGPLVVLFGRWVPGVRSLVSVPAGLLRMPRWEYLLFTVIGSAAWNTALVGAGWALGTQWERVSDLVGPLSKPLLALVVVAGAAALTWQGLRRRRARATA